jgi:CheY-like chemotaxis protein
MGVSGGAVLHPRAGRTVGSGDSRTPAEEVASAAFQLAGMRRGDSCCQTDLMPTTGGVVRCVIVDDRADFVDAAIRLLERQGITVVGSASTSTEALRCVDELWPDVILVDINLGAESGFELVEQLHREAPPAPPRVILISTHAEQDFADMIAASPAVGFLSKTALSAGSIHDLLSGPDDRAHAHDEGTRIR